MESCRRFFVMPRVNFRSPHITTARRREGGRRISTDVVHHRPKVHTPPSRHRAFAMSSVREDAAGVMGAERRGSRYLQLFAEGHGMSPRHAGHRRVEWSRPPPDGGADLAADPTVAGASCRTKPARSSARGHYRRAIPGSSVRRSPPDETPRPRRSPRPERQTTPPTRSRSSGRARPAGGGAIGGATAPSGTGPGDGRGTCVETARAASSKAESSRPLA